MEPSVLVALSMIFGVIVGGALVALLVFAARQGENAAAVVRGGVPDGVEQVVDALESPGIVVDPSNNVVTASPAASAYGLIAAGTLAADELVDIVDRVRRTGEPVSEELHVARGPYGDAHLVLVVRAAMLGSRYVFVLAEDHTEARRLDEVRRDFVANVSHELKTPIGAIGLLAEALQAASDDPDQVKRFAKRLSKESERLARLTKEIIELSRLQAADALAKPDLVDVDEVIVAAIDQNRVLADKRKTTILKGGTQDAAVYGDRDVLVAAINNLISNAVQYSPDGSRVGVGVSIVDDTVEISVTDQGIGIPEEDLERVFERFYRIDPARARNTGGSGLGLSIVKHVVQNHGGDVRVWSQVGRGSTFTVRLPAAEHPGAADETADPANRHEPAEPVTQQKFKGVS